MHGRILTIVLGVGLVSDVRAADEPDETSCTPLDQPGFRQAVVSARASIDAEDLDGFERWAAEIERSVPCLTFVPDPSDWGSWLVAVAAVDHFRGRDWQTPLGTALAADPGVDRLVGPGHENATWSPPPPHPSPGPVPRGQVWFVDGQPAAELPPAAGLHLVQREAPGGLQSRLLRDAPAPAEWLPERERAAQLVGWVGATGGVTLQEQAVDSPGTYADDRSRGLPDGGVQVRIYAGAPVGALVEFTTTLARPIDGLAAATVRLPWGAVGPGVVAVTVTRWEADAPTNDLLVAPALAAAAWTSGDRSVDAGGSLGLAPKFRHAALRAGITFPGRTLRARAGLEGRLAGAGYVQPGTERILSTTELRVAGQLGVVWGIR